MLANALQGVRVIDLSRILAGPWCTQNLADLGADVLKIERPVQGDDTRGWGPPFATAGSGEKVAAYFLSCNRGKRSVTADFADAADRDWLLRQVRDADVLVENYKVGTLAKYGLDYASLAAINPGLIYLSVTGFGQSGPFAHKPGYDYIFQGMGGLMSYTGIADGEPGAGPLRTGVAVVDLMTGMYAAQAVLAALFRRERTGKGQLIQMALYDCGLTVTGYYGLDALKLGHDPERYGNAHPSIVPYGMYEAADGPLIIAVGNNAQFEKFCRQVILRPDIIEDPRFSTNVNRTQNRHELGAMLKDLIRGFPREQLLERLAAAGIPCGRVTGLHEALTSERTRRGRLVQDMPHPVVGTTPVFAPPYRLDGQRQGCAAAQCGEVHACLL